jgi:hypothetical protein
MLTCEALGKSLRRKTKAFRPRSMPASLNSPWTAAGFFPRPGSLNPLHHHPPSAGSDDGDIPGIADSAAGNLAPQGSHIWHTIRMDASPWLTMPACGSSTHSQAPGRAVHGTAIDGRDVAPKRLHRPKEFSHVAV